MFAVTTSLAFYWGCFIFLISYIWIDTICPKPCLNTTQLETDDTGSVTSLEMIGKSVCPSCKKQHEHLEYICTSEIYQGIIYIYIYAFSRHFYPKRLTVHSGYTFICQYVCSLGIEPTTFCVTNAMLYPWATGTYPSITLLSAYTVDMICK